jgi:hypothetical protein
LWRTVRDLRSLLHASLHRHDLMAGLIFIAFAFFFIAQTFGLSGFAALFTEGWEAAMLDAELPIGTARRMGPGFFPLGLSGLLFGLGLVLVVRGVRMAPDGNIPPMPWRGLLFILGATVFFGVTVRGLGLVPATATTVLIASYASQRMTLRLAIVLSIALTVFVLAVFHYGLGMPLRLYGPWLDFLLGSDR